MARPLATFIGGPLDGGTTTRSCRYIDDHGQRVPIPTGERLWWKDKTVALAGYIRITQLIPFASVYVHHTVWVAWNEKQEALLAAERASGQQCEGNRP